MKKPALEKTGLQAPAKCLSNINKIILDNVPVSVVTIDKAGNITSTNKYFKNFSRDRSQRNRNIFTNEFFIREKLADDYKKLLQNGTPLRRDDCHQVNSKGEDKYLSIIAVPFRNKKGQVEGAISLASDNTEAVLSRHQLLELNNSLEEKVRHRTEELDKVNQELVKALKMKSVFMADISHEFRTSLTIMQCSLELLSKSCGLDGNNSELFEYVVKEIERASSMLTNLSLLAKSDSSELKLNYEKMDLCPSIDLICKELEVLARARNIKIEQKECLPQVKIMADKESIEKILLNLIRNAIKYNRDNGWVRVWVESEESGVSIKVQDSGIGIAEKDIPFIFDRFYRVDRSRARNGGEDSGLGLAICKHIVKAHGGRISAESKLGEGSLFSVFLPYEHKKQD